MHGPVMLMRKALWERIGFCVKPNQGSKGRCVFPNITDETWFRTTIDRVVARFPNILIEESVAGDHFRFLR